MLYIETSGNSMEAGRSIGRAFPGELQRCIEAYAPWLQNRSEKISSAIGKIQSLVRRHAPELWDETVGMSEGSGIELELLTGYRFFTDVRMHMEEGCTVVFFQDSDVGPLLGRNCDLSPSFDQDVQVCHANRAESGMSTLTVGYLGIPGMPGHNESGLAKGSASAHTNATGDRSEGLPGALLGGRILYNSGNLGDALAFLQGRNFLGKPYNLIICDSSGKSAVVEFAQGREPVIVPRQVGTRWQACTNFFTSGRIPIAPEAEYLRSAYSRYGRILHGLQTGDYPLTLGGMKVLLTEVAQPGLYTDELGGRVKTAFTHITEVANGINHITTGHPAESEFWRVEL